MASDKRHTTDTSEPARWRSAGAVWNSEPRALQPQCVANHRNGTERHRQGCNHRAQQNPEQKIIVLTITDSDQVIREALDAGARGFVLKSDAARDLVAAVEALQRDRMFFTPRVNDMVLAGFLDRGSIGSSAVNMNSPKLTPREREVIQLLAEGKSSKEVACLLNLSTKTAETHRSNIMRKLDFHSIRDLVVYAVKNDIIQIQISAPVATPERLSA